MNPSSTRVPNSWSGLCLVNVIRYAHEERKRNTYQLAILWHAASSMGPLCVKNAGPSTDINLENIACNHAWRTSLASG